MLNTYKNSRFARLRRGAIGLTATAAFLVGMALPGSAAAGEPSSADILSAALELMPDGYKELAEVSYESIDGKRFAPKTVTFLMPEKVWNDRYGQLDDDGRKALACKVKRELGMDCACETLEAGEAKDYAWYDWPDKRVVPVTLRFLIGC